MKGFVYLVRCHDFTKIGIADNIKKRLNALRVGNPYPVELLYSIELENVYKAERYLHERYADCRTRGEWFSLTDAQVEEIKAVDWVTVLATASIETFTTTEITNGICNSLKTGTVEGIMTVVGQSGVCVHVDGNEFPMPDGDYLVIKVASRSKATPPKVGWVPAVETEPGPVVEDAE
jgi:hypothetical protein